ncbi:MAG: cyanophycinase [Planctomycetes bacterium]|nr:cyanophycinase [Planctomycetota bacterium]
MRHRLAIVLLSTVGLAAQSPPAAPAAHPGTRLLAGGGRLPAEIFARFHELAGGAHAKVVLIPTASETADDDKENADTLRLYRERLPGAEVSLLHTRDRAVADDEAFCTPLARATGVWITGGAQDRLASAYLGTRVEKELLAVLARGGVIGGTSAGTAIQTRTMIQEGMDPPVMATGFDFVPGAISDQHFLKRQRLPRLLRALALHPGLFGIGVDESTAAVVHGDALDVIGASKVFLVLPEHDGHARVVVERAAGARVDLAAWRRAARERATWSWTDPASPRVAAGTLLLGDSGDSFQRFVAFAGGKAARVLVVFHGDGHHAYHSDTSTGFRELHEIRLTGPGAVSADELAKSIADATGVWLQDETPSAASAILDTAYVPQLRAALNELLARGGVVWGHALLGEVVTDAQPALDDANPATACRRGLALLPGSAMECSDPIASPKQAVRNANEEQTDLRRLSALCPPRFTGIRVVGSAVVQGAELSPADDSSATILPSSKAAGDAEREPIHLGPGTHYDLITGKRR